MDLKLPEIWKERMVQWSRDLVIVFAMWCIWLVSVYMPDLGQKNVIRVFLGLIIAIIILLGEHYRSVDYAVRDLEKELIDLKKS